MNINELKVVKRDEKGKKYARRLRSEGGIPAVLYGHDIDAMPLSLEANEFNKLTKAGGGHLLIKLKIAGAKESPTAIIKDIQSDPIRDNILHVDFLKVKMDEKIQSNVAVSIVGEAIGIKEGGIIQHGLWELLIEALPGDIPKSIDVDISELEIGDHFKVKDLAALDNIKILNPEEEDILSIIPPPTFKEEEVVAPEEEELEPEPEVVGEEAAAEGSGEE